MSHPAVMLVEPRIPQNVGAVGRVCAANGLALHVVRPIPFSLSDAALRRAGMDYLDLLDLHVHHNWPAACRELGGRRRLLFSSRGETCLYEVAFGEGDVLVFGSEPAGLPELLGAEFDPAASVRIPMENPAARCLNLATSAALGVYEALRQLRGW